MCALLKIKRFGYCWRGSNSQLNLYCFFPAASGFASRTRYLFGRMSIQMKVHPGDSAGTVSTFYVSVRTLKMQVEGDVALVGWFYHANGLLLLGSKYTFSYNAVHVEGFNSIALNNSTRLQWKSDLDCWSRFNLEWCRTYFLRFQIILVRLCIFLFFWFTYFPVHCLLDGQVSAEAPTHSQIGDKAGSL